MTRQGLRSPVAMVVLATLAEEPMHAYKVWDLIRARGKDVVVNVAQRNSVYQAIDRLQRDGLIERHGRSDPAAYTLTSDGERTLREWLESTLRDPAREFPLFPAGLAFLMLLPPKKALVALRERLEALRATIERDGTALASVRASGLPRLFLLDDEYRLAMAEAESRWIAGLVDDLETGAVTWSKKMIQEIARRFAAPS